MGKLSTAQVIATEGLDDWRVLHDSLHGSFRTGDMAAGLVFAAEVGVLADQANHHPDLGIRYARVLVELTTHDAGGLTQADIDLARSISALAEELGAAAEPAVPQLFEIAIDALDIDAVRPFWQAVTGFGGQDPLQDKANRLPQVWFQQMDSPRPQRNRIHLDVVVPHDQAQARVDAAIDAGGRLLSDERAPSFWVLADPEGNEACVCTALERD